MKLNISFILQFVGAGALLGAAYFVGPLVPKIVIYAGAATFGAGYYWAKFHS